jgi:hypothetical protein
MLHHPAIPEPDEMDLAEGDRPAGGRHPHNPPVWRLWKVQWTTTVSPSATTWWTSMRRSENPWVSHARAWVMPSGPGGRPAGARG